jgi:hypothetical protein
MPPNATTVFGDGPLGPSKEPEVPVSEIDLAIPHKTAKQRLVDEFDRRYLKALLAAHGNNISAAARTAGLERMTIYKMMRRLELDQQNVRTRPPIADSDGPSHHERVDPGDDTEHDV